MTNSWSNISIQEYLGKSRLVECKNQQPLKILNPKTNNSACHVVFSGYGGGMVSGDQIRIRIECKENSKTFIGTQANTRIYEQIEGSSAELELDVDIEKDSLLVIFPDPVVLQRESRFFQKQRFRLASGSTLFLVDWFNSGRIDIGEKFQFHSYGSEIQIICENKLKVLDRFSFNPSKHIPASPANFGFFNSMFNAYLVGNSAEKKFKKLSERLLALNVVNDNIFVQNVISKERLAISTSHASEGVIILRAASCSRRDAEPLCKYLMKLLEEEEFLGFNPMKRKY
jgi:urease accessory protein